MDEALPHVQQGVGVECEGCNVVDEHDVHTEALPAGIWQNGVYIGCSMHIVRVSVPADSICKHAVTMQLSACDMDGACHLTVISRA